MAQGDIGVEVDAVGPDVAGEAHFEEVARRQWSAEPAFRCGVSQARGSGAR